MAHIPFWRYHPHCDYAFSHFICKWMVESFVERVPSKKNQLPDCGVRIFWGQVLQQILEKLSKKGRQGFIAKIWKWETFNSSTGWCPSNWDMGEILLIPPGMYKTCIFFWNLCYINWCRISEPSTVVIHSKINARGDGMNAMTVQVCNIDLQRWRR